MQTNIPQIMHQLLKLANEVDVDAVSDGERVLIQGLLEHVERAGVHSGDSVGVFPPQNVGDGDQLLIVETMERIVLALGAAALHAFWNLLLARERDPEAATAVAVLSLVVILVLPAALTWRVDGDAVPYLVASAALELLYVALLAAARSSRSRSTTTSC